MTESTSVQLLSNHLLHASRPEAFFSNCARLISSHIKPSLRVWCLVQLEGMGQRMGLPLLHMQHLLREHQQVQV